MGRLIYILFLLIQFSQSALARSEATEDFSNYRQIAMDLDAYVSFEKFEIPKDATKWPMVSRITSPENSKSSRMMAMLNKLALVPGYPTINCFEKTYAREHNGSKVIAVSRVAVNWANKTGRYVIFQTFDPDSVWATWLSEEDAKTLFTSLGGFEPSKEPLLFPEIEKQVEIERIATERDRNERQKMAEDQLAAREAKRPDMKGKPREGVGKHSTTKAHHLWWSVAAATFLIMALAFLSLLRRKKSSTSTV